MAAEHESLKSALERVDRAVRAVYSGDHIPFAELWSRQEDASLFGAFGTRPGGLAGTQRGVPVGGRPSAYTVGYERAHVSIDGRKAAPSTIRITHVYRRERGRWMLVHRHGDFAPLDDSPLPNEETD